MMRRFVSVLSAMLIAVGCAANWVHWDPDADWDADYADCSQKAETAGSGEVDKQVIKVCLEANGWVEDKTSKPRRPPTPPRTPSRPEPYGSPPQ